jgi:UDP-3-O-[3-hydroxymyristoyl] glucosamine N-acyltransferase
MASGGLSLSDLTAAIVESTQGRLRAELRGSPERQIASVAPLATAAAADLAFLANPRYLHDARQSRAGAIVLTARDADAVGA